MKPKNVFIVRHGQSEGNVNDQIYKTKPDYSLDLTPLGEEQAILAGHKLKKLIGDGYVGFYTSPYFRTKQTLFNIKKSFAPDRMVWTYEDPRLREQEWGNFQPAKMGVDAYEEERYRFGSFFYRFNLGESGADVYDRCSMFLDTLYRDFEKENCPENIVIACHGFTMRVLVTRWLHIDFVDFQRIDNPKNCEIIQLAHNGRKYELASELRKTHPVPPYIYRDEPNRD